MQPIVTPDTKKDGKSVLNKNNDSDSGSDDCLILDVSVFKKPKLQPEPQKNTEMQLKVSNPFTDKDKKECVLVTMKTNFYRLKANGITSVLKTFFESILQGKKNRKGYLVVAGLLRNARRHSVKCPKLKCRRDMLNMWLC